MITTKYLNLSSYVAKVMFFKANALNSDVYNNCFSAISEPFHVNQNKFDSIHFHLIVAVVVQD